MSQRDPGNIYVSKVSRFFEDRSGEQRKDRIPDWMDDVDLFVLGVANTYAAVNEQILRELLILERENGGYINLENKTTDDVQDSVQKLVDRSVLEHRHCGYHLTDLGRTYASDFSGWPTASGFLSKYRIPAIVFVIGIIAAWILLLPVSTGVCQQVGFPDAYTCGLPAVILPLSAVSGLILSGRGWRVAKEAAAFINADIRYGSGSNIEVSAFKTAVYSRLADTIPAPTILMAATSTLLLLLLDVFVVSGEMSNQVYGLVFDGFGGYLLAKSEFLRGELRLSSGNDLQTKSGSDQVQDILDGAFGFSLLILGFSLQLAAVFPMLRFSTLVWMFIDSIIKIVL